MTIEQGIWKHFKGGEYDVIGVSVNRDTGQELVVYRPRYGERRLEVRPLEQWTEHITRPGYEGPRYWLLMSNREGQKQQ